MARVTFRFLTGLKRNIFTSAQLTGSWNEQRQHSTDWSAPISMQPIIAEDGCPAFKADVELQGNNGQQFCWGVIVSTATGQNIWGIMPEVHDRNSNRRVRTFVLQSGTPQTVDYFLCHARRVGAQKLYLNPPAADLSNSKPAIRFIVWAPNARQVDVVMAKTWDLDNPQRVGGSLNVEKIAGGYIDPANIDVEYPMVAIGDGYWATEPTRPDLASFEKFDHRPYMYKVTCDDGVVR